MALSFCTATSALGQTPQYYSVPTGHQPLGVVGAANPDGTGSAVVANSGDNSVSVLQWSIGTDGITLTSSTTLTGIPSPYGVADCGDGFFLVTSPSDNSVRLIGKSSERWQVLGTLNTGSQPYSVACYTYYTGTPPPAGSLVGHVGGIVSNWGDSSITLFDVPSLTNTVTLPNVPGSRGFHGIAVQQLGVFLSSVPYGVVASADGNTVTIVKFSPSPGVVGQLPFARPTAVFFNGGNEAAIGEVSEVPLASFWVASAQANSLFLFEAMTGKVDQMIPNVPNPQDGFGTGACCDSQNAFIGRFAVATIGGADAICWVDSSGAVRTLPGIPQPASVAAATFPTQGNLFIGNPISAGVLVTSTSTDSLYVVYLPVSAPAQFAAQNAAAPEGLAPGSLASAFASTGASQNSSAASVPLPNTLSGLTLGIGGALSFDATAGKWNYSSTGSVQAPLLFAGPNQINFQVPTAITPGSAVPAQLTKPDGTTLLTTLNITATAPGIFTVLQNGQGPAAVLNQDNTPNFVTDPAARGSVIQIYATGAGATTPVLMPGEPAPASGNPLVLTNVQPMVTIGDVPATVTFSGMAPGYVGLWQINAVVPQSVTPGNAVPLIVSAGGVASNTVTITVQ